MVMRIDAITPFPEMIKGVFDESMLSKAREKDLVKINVWDLRTFTSDPRMSVDDYPYGGGAGMILKPEPIFRAIDHIKKTAGSSDPDIILMSPQGERFTQKKADQMSKKEHLIFLCGHYRGVDERVIEYFVTEEISIGDYILTGGELPAAVVIDAVVRLIPGVLGDFDSAEGDSFINGLLDHPHYTRPPIFRGLKVPDILLSGHHKRVREWRKKQALNRTNLKRPDLLQDTDDDE